MMYKAWQGFCLCGPAEWMPPEGEVVSAPFSPLNF